MSTSKGWFLAVICAALSAHSAAATTLLFDFGYANSKSGANNYNDVIIDDNGVISPQPIVLPNLIDNTGASTGIGLSAQGFFPGGNPNGTTTPSGAAAATFVATAMVDNFFTHVGAFGGQATNPKGSVVLTGLDNATAYDFTFFASRMGPTDNRETKYTVTGSASAFALLNATGNNSNIASVAGIHPNAGSITIDVEAGPNNDNGGSSSTATRFAYLGAMRIDSTAVPEPTALSLLVLSSLGLAFRRRFA